MAQPYVKISSYSHSSSYAPLYSSDITKQLLHVQRVGLTFCKEDYRVMNRTIDSYLICYVFKGQGFIDYNSQHHFLETGELFVIDCHQPHSYYPDEKNPFSLLFLHFQGPYGGHYIETITGHQNIFTQEEITHTIRKKIGFIYSLFRTQNHPNTFRLSSFIYDILMTLLDYTNELKHQEVLIPSSIVSASKYIEENFTQHILIPQLAKQVSMSEYHFIREFKKYIHQSPYEYVLYCRFHHSKELLLKTDMTISEIADFLQFHSLSHYVSFFKKRESMTPLQFRKRYSIKT